MLIWHLPYFGGSTDPVQRSTGGPKIGETMKSTRKEKQNLRKERRKWERKGKSLLRRTWKGGKKG